MKPSVFAAAAGLLLSLSIQAQDNDELLDKLAEACQGDKEKYCSQVTPGDPRRMLACAYAHEDKLSGQCSYALYETASALEELATALNYLATECTTDIEALCADVKMGDGRVLECLMGQPEAVSDGCNKAIADTVEVD